jgi:hypothetical protein
MGATKKTYWISTLPLEEIELFEWKSKQTIIDKWGAKPNTEKLYNDSSTFRKLVSACTKANKARDEYINKFNK